MKKIRPLPDLPPEKTHNTRFFYKRLREAFKKAKSRRPYEISSLGKVGEFDLYFCKPEKIDPKKKNVLVCGGFHGEEPAGSWGIVHFLETATREELNAVNLFFLPLVNPTGFDQNRRHNDWDEDPNQGFGDDDKKPSEEGRLLLRNLNELLKAAADGFLSLHEDSDMTKTYLWTYEAGESKPGDFTGGLRQTIEKHFEVFSGEIPHRGGTVDIKDGVGFNITDNSFESMLFRRGISFLATPETPAHESVPIGKRVRCNRDIISTFIKLRK